MSTSVDNRIVEMEFDNQQFESGVATTMDTLAKFKEALKFEGAEKGLENIGNIAENFDMSGMDEAVENTSSRFSSLAEIGVGALRKIGEMAADTGMSLVKNLANTLVIEPISAGMTKYESSLKSVQTMLAALPDKDINDVQAAMDKLNWYTDETSYSYSDMAENIARFTSNGVDLDDATTAMIGIANAAGLAGTETALASHAMEGFSKAMGQGFMNGQSWNWIKTARMDTQATKQALIDAAVETGQLEEISEGLYRTTSNTAKAGMEVSANNFLEALGQAKWLDSQTMMTALSKFGSATEEIFKITEIEGVTATEVLDNLDYYTSKYNVTLDETSLKAFRAGQEYRTFTDAIEATKDAVSTGWMKTFRYLFGNYEEAKELWTSLGDTLWDVFASGGDIRNDVLAAWSEMGGRDSFIEGIYNLGNGLMTVITPFQEAFSELFGFGDGEYIDVINAIAERVFDLTEKFRAFTEYLVPSEETLEALKNVILGIIAPFKVLGTLISGAAYAFSPLLRIVQMALSAFAQLAGKVGLLVANFGDLLISLIQSSGIFDKIHRFLSIIVKLIGYFGEAFETVLTGVGRLIRDTFDLGGAFDFIADLWTKFTSLFEGVSFLDWFDQAVNDFGLDLAYCAQDIVHFLRDTEAIKKVGAFFEPGVKAVKEFASSFVLHLGTAIEKVKEFVKNVDFIGLLSDTFVTVRDWFVHLIDLAKGFVGNTEAFQTISKWLNPVVDQIKSLVKEFGPLQTVGLVIGFVVLKIKDFAVGLYELVGNSGVLELVTKWFWDAVDSVEEFGSKLSDFLLPIIDKAKSTFSGFWDKIKSINFSAIKDLFSFDGEMDFSSAKGFFDSLGRYVSSFGDKLGAMINPNGEGGSLFGGLFTTIKTQFESLIPEKGVLRSIYDWFVNVKNQIVGLFTDKSVKAQIGGLFDGINIDWSTPQKAVDDLIAAYKTLKERVIDFVKSNETLNSIAEKIIYIKDLAIEAFKRIGAALKEEGLMNILERILNIVETIIKIKVLTSAGGMFEAWGAGFDKLTTAGADLLKVFGGSAQSVAGGLNGLFTSISGYFNRKEKQPFALTLLEIAGAIAILAGSLWLIAQIPAEDLTRAGTTLGALAVVLVTLGGVVAILTQITSGTQFAAMSVGLLILSGAILAMIAVIKIIASSGINYKLVQDNIESFIVIFGTLAILMGITRIAGKGALGAGMGVLGLSAGILILIKCIKSIAEITDGELTRGIAVVTGLSVIMGLVIALSGRAQYAGKAGSAFLKLSLAIAILTICINALGKMDPQDVIIGTAAIGALMIVMGLVIKMAGFWAVNGSQAGSAFLKMSIAIGILTICITALGKLDPQALVQGELAIIALIAVLGLFSLAAQAAKDSAGGIIAMGVLVGAITLSLSHLSTLDWASVLASAVSLSLVIAALTITIGVMGTIGPKALSAIGVAFAMGIFLAEIVAALSWLSRYDSADNLKNALALALVGGALTVVVGVFGALGLVAIKGAITAVASLTILFGGMMGLVEALGYLSQYATHLDKGFEFLNKLGKGIGEFIGNLIGSAVETASSYLPDIGTNLSDFATNIEGFVQMVNGLDDGFATNLATLVDAVGKLTAAAFWNDLGSRVGLAPDLVGYAEKLKAFADPFTDFLTKITSVENLDAVGDSVKVAESLAALNNHLPPSGGLIQEWFGEKDLDRFGDGLKSFAYGFRMYANELGAGGINWDSVKQSIGIAELLAEFNNKLPPSGGLIQEWFGEKDMSVFGKGLTDFGSAFKDYATEIGNLNVNWDNVKKSAAAAEVLAEFNDKLPESGGRLQQWIGSKDLVNFATGLKEFGPAFSQYASSIDGVDPGVVEKSAAAAKSIAEFAKEIPNYGGVIADLIGDNSLSTFARDLNGFATEYQAFSEKLVNVQFGAITKFKNTFQDLLDVVNLANGTDTYGLVNLASAMGGAAFDAINALAETLVSSQQQLSQAVTTMVGYIVTALQTNQVLVTTQAQTLCKAVIDTFVAELPDETFSRIGRGIILAFIDGILRTRQEAINAAIELCQAVTNAVQTEMPENVWYDIGANAAMGLAQGIRDKIGEVANAAIEASREAVAAARRTLDEASPSKVFHEIGAFTMIGMANGITDNMGQVSVVSEAAAKEAIDAFSYIASIIMAAMDDELNLTPIITPVLDLSNVAAGSETMDSLLNGSSIAAGVSVPGYISPNSIAQLTSSIENMASKMQGQEKSPINIYVTGGPNANAEEIAEEVINRINIEYQRQRAVWA